MIYTAYKSQITTLTMPNIHCSSRLQAQAVLLEEPDKYTSILTLASVIRHKPEVILFMVALSSCFFFFLLLSFFPHLISVVIDWMFTILWHMVWP